MNAKEWKLRIRVAQYNNETFRKKQTAKQRNIGCVSFEKCPYRFHMVARKSNPPSASIAVKIEWRSAYKHSTCRVLPLLPSPNLVYNHPSCALSEPSRIDNYLAFYAWFGWQPRAADSPCGPSMNYSERKSFSSQPFPPIFKVIPWMGVSTQPLPPTFWRIRNSAGKVCYARFVALAFKFQVHRAIPPSLFETS